MPFIVLIAFILFGLYFLLTWLSKIDGRSLAKALKIFISIVVISGILLAIVSGRGLHGLGLSVLLLPFFFRWSAIRKREKEDKDSGKTSENSASENSASEDGYFDHPMTQEEAREVLGVIDPLTYEKIIKAYKSMMKRSHPDRGGSSYLAQQVNEAKEILLKALKKN